MKPHAVPLPASAQQELPGADFGDAFAIDLAGARLDARGAAVEVFTRVPGWVDGLLRLRNLIVRPLGLKGTDEVDAGKRDRIGFFPVISETERRLVLGFDDRHLDFRVIVDVEPLDANRQRVVATTLVKRHNCFGRAYLAAIMPFHKVIVPTMLGRIARAA